MHGSHSGPSVSDQSIVGFRMASTIPDLVQAYLSEPPQDSGDSVHLQAPQASTSSTFPSHSSSIASGSSSTRIPSEIASLIASKSLLNHPAGASATGVGGGGTLLDVVRASQEWLTSDEDAKRGRGEAKRRKEAPMQY